MHTYIPTYVHVIKDIKTKQLVTDIHNFWDNIKVTYPCFFFTGGFHKDQVRGGEVEGADSWFTGIEPIQQPHILNLKSNKQTSVTDLKIGFHFLTDLSICISWC